jgi:hypothetical protein
MEGAQRQLFRSFLGYGVPDYVEIRRLLTEGGADINKALKGPYGDFQTILHFIHGMHLGTTVSTLLDPMFAHLDPTEDLAKFKKIFYPTLDILEEFNFDIMNGASYRRNGPRDNFSGLGILDLVQFQILAKYDMPRLIRFLEHLYFSKGHPTNPAYLATLMAPPVRRFGLSTFRPALILYLIMKGTDWSAVPEADMRRFAEQVPPQDAATMIADIQNTLGGNYIVGPNGKNLREFLVQAYGAGHGVAILESAAKRAAFERRLPILDAAFGNQVGGRRRRTRRSKAHRRRTVRR